MADTAPAPKALPERLAELINRLNNGDIKVPAFQRGFIWKPGQVIDLLDSVYRGYPIGSLLFWRTEESLAAERDMGDFQLPETPEKYPRNYILDGQQRLTAVYGVLTFAGDSSSDSQFNVSFDFDGDRFVTGPPPEFTVVMPMNVLFDTKKFIAFQRQLEEDDRSDLLDATVRLYDRFHEYQVPVVTVQDLPIESVAVIFERINSTGTKLTMLDLMVAATWSQDFDLRDALEDVIDVLTKKSYDGINPTAVLQVLSAVTGSSVSRDAIYGLRTMSPGDLTAHVSVVEQALRRSVDFLSTQLHVKTDDFLPYERQLVALGYIFSKHKTLTAAQSQNLQRWFWRTSFSERYRRGGEGLFDEDLASLEKALADVSELERFGRPPDSLVFLGGQFRRGTALTNAFVALLASAHPRSLVTADHIDVTEALSSYNRKEFHHIFPQAYLKSVGAPALKTNSLANICMLPAEHNKVIGDKPPSKYVPDIQARLGDAFLAVIESNLIPPTAVDSLLVDDLDTFLEIRSEHIAGVAAAKV